MISFSRIILTVIVLFCFLDISFGQEIIHNTKKKKYREVTARYFNGEEKTVLIGMPIMQYDKFIFLKKAHSSPVEKINPDDIESIKISAVNGEFSLLRKHLIKKKGEVKNHYYFWVEPVMKCKEFNVFSLTEGYTISERTENFSNIYSGAGSIHIQEKGLDYAVFAAVFYNNDGVDKVMDVVRARNLRKYFKDDPKVLSIIKDRKGITDRDMLDLFTEMCSEKN